MTPKQQLDHLEALILRDRLKVLREIGARIQKEVEGEKSLYPSVFKGFVETLTMYIRVYSEPDRDRLKRDTIYPRCEICDRMIRGEDWDEDHPVHVACCEYAENENAKLIAEKE